MRPTLKDLLHLLDRMAPFRLAETWDNSGLQVGSASWEARGVHVALDPGIRALKGAVESGCGVLLTHHPLLFRPLARVETDIYPGEVVKEAVRHEVAVVAMHTNLDAAPGGINDILAELLGLTDVEVLEESESAAGAGIGRVGNLPAPVPASEFLGRIGEIMGARHLGVVNPPRDPVRRVAVVGGSGGGLLRVSAEKRAQVLVTGDIGHHHALEAGASGLCVVDAGHYRTERCAMEVFSRRLGDAFLREGWHIPVHFDRDEKDPIERWSGRKGDGPSMRPPDSEVDDL
ncbi:MAG: Nif3-like dinuclear metal center hexameric protein [Deltaproteobacteria bacterium]|nr:Nif3-like dinuclear metal center hexameric protein [Deltaproteobacteria bacterium]MBW1948337.1 Nif3-like dinuclear metal center hexameric protein [Deltaproteobacteria bacterium]MBW2006621.1 Nif3-like dinuclear metal center hexameric protein [Deltaproteobacteria bacterium]MBW2101494.1 Nif3-like dinuclear metal center hexameric protein [Deltaproteobacteria bacterium]MBW2347227.1 Nif3-like dinuclear metal center hexameric protein [Deltaproteobacteria bacterium]